MLNGGFRAGTYGRRMSESGFGPAGLHSGDVRGIGAERVFLHALILPARDASLWHYSVLVTCSDLLISRLQSLP